MKVKARVKPNNNYGGYGAGSVVEVEPEEIERAYWCLEPVHISPAAQLQLAELELDELKAKVKLAEAKCLEARQALSDVTPPPVQEEVAAPSDVTAPPDPAEMAAPSEESASVAAQDDAPVPPQEDSAPVKPKGKKPRE